MQRWGDNTKDLMQEIKRREEDRYFRSAEIKPDEVKNFADKITKSQKILKKGAAIREPGFAKKVKKERAADLQQAQDVFSRAN